MLFTAAAEYIDQFAAIVAVEVRYLAQRVLGRSKLFRAADQMCIRDSIDAVCSKIPDEALVEKVQAYLEEGGHNG